MVEFIEIQQSVYPEQWVDEWRCAEGAECCNATCGKGGCIGWWFDDGGEVPGVFWTACFAAADQPGHRVCEDCATWIEEGRP